MSLIVDASVATKWFFEENDFQVARALLNTGDVIFAPDLVIAEVGNAFWKRCRLGYLSPALAVELLGTLPKLFDELIPFVNLSSAAMELSAELPHPIYDCFYLALAERERMPILSADSRMIAAGKRLGTIDMRKL